MSSAYHVAECTRTDRAELFAEVLSGRSAGTEPAAPAATERLAQGLSHAHALLLIGGVEPAADADSPALRGAVDMLLAAFVDSVEVPITWAVTGHATLAVPATTGSWARRDSLLGAVVQAYPVLVFVTPPAGGAESLREAYERATALLHVARSVRKVPGIIGEADVRLLHLAIAGDNDHQRYLDEVLGPILRLPAKQRDRLLETLVAFRDTSLRGGLRAAAKMLGVHEKTVAYRTRRIVELTGLDLDLPYARAQLIVALELLALSGWDLGRERLLCSPFHI